MYTHIYAIHQRPATKGLVMAIEFASQGVCVPSHPKTEKERYRKTERQGESDLKAWVLF